MYFLMINRHKSGVAALRDELRPSHRAYVADGGGGTARVLIGSALLDPQSEQGSGNFGILEADSLEQARAFAEGDPFNKGGVVETIEITRLPDSFQAHRIEPMTK
ncbi:YciI family protein [Rhizobium sp. RU36D]|uniref:YciI family protein n=1 Tax=Rhizobium sp. RU36D TaxID=1907415 RepID=UPI0009D7EF60|nr:YciI family protein [Rhizobium sp. RU36D]SMD01456.1 hypothetical protein SAMN05880593_11547 [Rhizobium sp. RU36D]